MHDAQFSIAHGIALAAHFPPPGRAWQDPKLVFSPSVMGLMNKVKPAREVVLEFIEDYVAAAERLGASLAE